jgi:hypothetical protein
MNIKVSDVKLALTEVQYGMLLALSRSIPRIFAGGPEGAAQSELTKTERRDVEGFSAKDYNLNSMDSRTTPLLEPLWILS